MRMDHLKENSPIRISKNFDMPSIPLVLMKILRMIDDDRVTAKKLEELIRHDPAISARIFRLANSAFYSFRCRVRTISHAITLLGLNMVKSLAIGVSIFESLTKGLRKDARYIRQLWIHSFGVGVLAKEIWGCRSNRIEGEFAFLCGLLHDMGMVVYFKQGGARYGQLFTAEKDDDNPGMCELEWNQYGVNHTTVGSMLAAHWDFPPDLGAVIEQHHDPFNSSLPIVSAISLADMLAKQAGIGYDGDNKIDLDLDALRERLNMDQEEYDLLTIFSFEIMQNEIQDFFKAR